MTIHITDFPRSDHLWHDVDISQEELMEILGKLSATYRPREAFGYSNLMYLTLGKVVDQVTGPCWKEEIKPQILQPLGMEAIMVNTFTLTSYQNVASSHQLIEGRFVEIPYLDTKGVAPAGAICSNMEDMIRWVTFQLTQNLPLLSQ